MRAPKMLEQYQLQQKVSQTKLAQNDDQDIPQELNDIDDAPSTNFRGMAMQTAGFSRSARSVNSTISHDYLLIPRTCCSSK